MNKLSNSVSPVSVDCRYTPVPVAVGEKEKEENLASCWQSPYSIFSRGGSPSENLTAIEKTERQMAKFAEYTAKEEGIMSPISVNCRYTPLAAEGSNVKLGGRVALALTASSFTPVALSQEAERSAKIKEQMVRFAEYTAKEEGFVGAGSLFKRSFSAAGMNSNS